MAKITAKMTKLLVAIAASDAGFLMLSQAEGAEIVNAGLAVVDTSNVEGDKAAVSLTDAGRAALPAEDAAAKPAGGYEIRSGFTPPERQRRGREGGYPFDKLEVGQAFFVPGSDTKALVARLQSSVSGARAKYAVETGETETVTVKEYQRVEGGNGFAKDAEGKRIVTGERTETRPKMAITRDFAIKEVDGGVEVGRIK